MIGKMKDTLGGGLEAATRRGASAAKIEFEQEERIGCTFESGRLKSAETVQGSHYTVTVLAGGKKGEATGTAPGDLDEMIGRAVSLAAAGSAAHFDAWPAPGEITPVETWSRATAALPREKLIDGCQEMADALKAYDPELFIEAFGTRIEAERLLRTTGGVCHESTSTQWQLGSWAQWTEGTDMLFAGFGRRWGELGDLFDPPDYAARIVEDLRNGETVADAPTGATTALLAPEVLAMLLQAIALGVSGRNVVKGESPLRGLIGEKVLHEAVTIVDDPHSPYSHGSAEIDSDGVPTRRVEIFADGVLNGFLYDLDSAGLARAEPTGNDACRPHFDHVLPGGRPHEELLAGIDDGIYVKYLMGFGQGNLINGDFSCNVAIGYRVSNGRIVGRVKNAMAAGNVYELLAGDVELSSDDEPGLRLPWALVGGLNVAAAQG